MYGCKTYNMSQLRVWLLAIEVGFVVRKLHMKSWELFNSSYCQYIFFFFFFCKRALCYMDLVANWFTE